eukprot:1392776-Amorphochlora_amoeboformis.AAC.2
MKCMYVFGWLKRRVYIRVRVGQVHRCLEGSSGVYIWRWERVEEGMQDDRDEDGNGLRRDAGCMETEMGTA